MFYCVVFLCLFIFSGTAVSKKNKGFYISGYNTSNVRLENQTYVFYRYKNNEVLNLSCHMETRKPLLWLKWLHNEQAIPGKNVSATVNKLQFNIDENNDKDRLECYAFEDGSFGKDEKTVKAMIALILEYDGQNQTTTAPDVSKSKRDKESFFDKLLKSTLFWIAVVVFIVVIILATIIVCATEKTACYRIKKDKVGLHPATSNTSVFTTESRTPVLPYHNIAEENFYTNETRTDKVGLNLAVSNASYFTMESRKSISPHTEVFYTNDTYNKNKTQLNGSRVVTNSEYQEPVDSQAYCEPQMYSEPEKQFYAEPIPKILRVKNTPYVNCNKNNDSSNINKENIDAYQNCEEISDDEFYFYTEAS